MHFHSERLKPTIYKYLYIMHRFVHIVLFILVFNILTECRMTWHGMAWADKCEGRRRCMARCAEIWRYTGQSNASRSAWLRSGMENLANILLPHLGFAVSHINYYIIGILMYIYIKNSTIKKISTSIVYRNIII